MRCDLSCVRDIFSAHPWSASALICALSESSLAFNIFFHATALCLLCSFFPFRPHFVAVTRAGHAIVCIFNASAFLRVFGVCCICSGGCIRTVIIDKDGQKRDFMPGQVGADVPKSFHAALPCSGSCISCPAICATPPACACCSQDVPLRYGELKAVSVIAQAVV